MSINKIAISGNLGRDAEVRETKDHVIITRFSLAYPMCKRTEDGSWADETGWIDAVIFGLRGEKLSPYLTKGRPVTIAGKLSYSTFLDQNKVKRSAHEIVVDEIAFGAARQKDDSGDAALSEEDIAF